MGGDRLKTISLSFFILILLIRSAFAWGGEVYKWVDERGTVHFDEDPYKVPEMFRDRVERIVVPDALDEPMKPLEETPPPSVAEAERPRVSPSPPPSGFVPFDKFKHITEGMSEAEVLSRLGPPTQEVRDEAEVKGYYTPGSMVKREVVIKRYYYIGDPDLGERTTVIHFKNGVVTKIERIFPPTW
ncbi:MAG: DUF4124 domain-containing protein [Syntrophaceae bacterium]|nr:DUF4124 domain-containing protein [Syntrophaceae bacterium]